MAVHPPLVRLLSILQIVSTVFLRIGRTTVTVIEAIRYVTI